MIGALTFNTNTWFGTPNARSELRSSMVRRLPRYMWMVGLYVYQLRLLDHQISKRHLEGSHIYQLSAHFDSSMLTLLGFDDNCTLYKQMYFLRLFADRYPVVIKIVDSTYDLVYERVLVKCRQAVYCSQV